MKGKIKSTAEIVWFIACCVLVVPLFTVWCSAVLAFALLIIHWVAHLL